MMLPLSFERLPADEQLRRAQAFFGTMRTRRSVRDFSPEPVPYELIETAIHTAVSAPSGANKQPWHFCVIQDPAIKRRIRKAAEAEERQNYERRFPQEWLDDLAPFGTDWRKPFLEIAPYLIVLFRLDHALGPMGFLSEILDRPKNERAFLLIPVGYPAENAQAPDLEKKALIDMLTLY